MNFPKITVVTPSYNQGRFLEQTMLSVLGQMYENLEYIVIDGGSSDDSAEVIERHAAKLAYWVTEKDSGQAHAINKGFARATGDVLCWLNSDDFFLPGILHQIGRHFSTSKGLIYGDCLTFSDKGARSLINRPPEYDRELLGIWDYVVQPSSFWSRELWERTGPLNQDLHYAFDWEWFLRASQHGDFVKLESLFSAYRFHETHKSSSGGGKRVEEIISVAKTHGGESAVRHYEFARDHLPALRRYELLSQRLKGRGIRSHSDAALLVSPSLWKLPPDIEFELLRKCVAMLGYLPS